MKGRIKMTELKYFKKMRANDSYISSTVLQIKIDEIRPNRNQPRAEFDNNSIIRLADSIRRYGILQPLTARRITDEESYKYELIAGERRFRAARLLGYMTVPCIIIEADERMSAEMAIIENLLREDLNMFEQAYGFKQLIDIYGLTQDEVARKMSLSQSAIANKLRLLKLSYEEQRLIVETGLTERHARALLKVESQQERIEIIKHISSYNLNVTNTELYIENLLSKISEEAPAELVDGNTDAISSQQERAAQSEKSMRDMINGFQRRVDMLKKSGKNASISVVDDQNVINVHITINKD